MAYGYEVQEGRDPYVDLVEVAVDQFSASTRPGAFLVDIFPFLRYVPSWVPGANFKRTAVSWGKTLNDMVDVPFELVKRRMASGHHPLGQCVCTNVNTVGGLHERPELYFRSS